MWGLFLLCFGKVQTFRISTCTPTSFQDCFRLWMHEAVECFVEAALRMSVFLWFKHHFKFSLGFLYFCFSFVSNVLWLVQFLLNQFSLPTTPYAFIKWENGKPFGQWKVHNKTNPGDKELVTQFPLNLSLRLSAELLLPLLQYLITSCFLSD